MAAYEVWSNDESVKLLSPGDSTELRQSLLNQGFRLIRAFKFDSADTCGLSGRKVRCNPSVEAWVKAATLKQSLIGGRSQSDSKPSFFTRLWKLVPSFRKAPT